ncbi:RNA polymerase sigma factor, sigma-70 family [Singulisphaera sp. GP187]|uniref:sigma-70 family RNA polymerase sigma factor n=1 Tax=Singulisphaera sp. GP187 TaxID=1882752 RepID=UPI00092802D0|nr:sigma-70 family RNA polymerase sigma factor [Singulisphaera sp. GP187]SIO37182.1 RNA polymerase sigma factor, sigma-70 family [Singulisphaera sp. GP187]
MDRLTEEKKALAEKSVSRAEHIARRYARIYPLHEDELKSRATLGVVRAAASFEPNKNGVWKRWAGLQIRGEIKDYLRKLGPERCELATPEELSEIVDTSNETLDRESDDHFASLLKVLPKKQREICSLVYKMNMSPSEAGVALGHGARHGRKIHDAALKALRGKLEATGSG